MARTTKRDDEEKPVCSSAIRTMESGNKKISNRSGAAEEAEPSKELRVE